MTVRQFYTNLLIELNKVNAPHILLEDFNYYINKSIIQYINKRYNLQEVNQQVTDDLRVLQASTILIPQKNTEYTLATNLLDSMYWVYLPDDYVHILNCVAEYIILAEYGCYDSNTLFHFPARKLTSDKYPTLIKNYYFKPNYKRPYFYINNFASDIRYPIIETLPELGYGTLISQIVIQYETLEDGILPPLTQLTWVDVTHNGITYHYRYHATITGPLYFSDILTLQAKFTALGVTTNIADGNIILTQPSEDKITSVISNTIPITTTSASDTGLVSKVPEVRYGNSSRVRMEIRYGSDAIFKLNKLYVDYLRAPKHLLLTQTQLDAVEDTSQLLEFSDVVCHEILKELTNLLLENSSDPRLRTHAPVNQSIGMPELGQKR